MENRDNQNKQTGQDTDISKSQSSQQPASSQDDTSATQTGGFKQPEQGSDQQVDTAGETTTLGQDGTDIEGSSEFGSKGSTGGSTGEAGTEGGQSEGTGQSSDSNFVGSKGQTDTSSELVDNEQADKDGQPPLDGE